MNRTKFAAIGAGALLALASLAIPSSAFAAGNSITASPNPTTISPAGSTGGTFTINVTGNGSVAISAAGAALSFDKSRLQVTAIAKDATEVTNGVSYAGFPTAGNMVSFLATANSTGTIPTIGWFYVDGSSAETAGVEHGIFSATFQVIATGNSSVTPVVIPGVGGLNDGTSANYGAVLSPITINSASVVNPASTPTPVPTATSVPTPTPVPASAAPGTGTTNVTGSLDSGFLGISVPANVTIPLVRNATNTKVVPVTIFANILWNLNVADPKATHTGYMTDGTKVLSNPMFVQIYDASNTLVNQVNLTTGGLLWTGSNSASVNSTLSQFVAPQDPPSTNYGIQVQYSAVSGF